MGLQRIERTRKFLAYEYDATVDGGAADTYEMRPLDSVDTLSVGVVLLEGFMTIEADFVDTDGMDAATIDVGDGTDPDRFFDTTVVAAASEGDVVAAETSLKLAKLASGEIVPVVTIGGGGLDAGKVRAYFEYVLPLAT